MTDMVRSFLIWICALFIGAAILAYVADVPITWPRSRLITAEVQTGSVRITPSEGVLAVEGADVELFASPGEAQTFAYASLDILSDHPLRISRNDKIFFQGSDDLRVRIISETGNVQELSLGSAGYISISPRDFLVRFRGSIELGDDPVSGRLDLLHHGRLRFLETSMTAARYEAKVFDLSAGDRVVFTSDPGRAPAGTLRAEDNPQRLEATVHSFAASPEIYRYNVAPFRVEIDGFDRVLRNPDVQVAIILLSLILAALGIGRGVQARLFKP